MSIHINSTLGAKGRFANHFIRNMAVHCIARLNDLHITYSYAHQIATLGIQLYSGQQIYSDLWIFNDSEFFEWIREGKRINFSIVVNPEQYAQTREFAFYLRNYLHEPVQQTQIRAHNHYSNRYGSNSDVFVHVRLGDVPQLNPGFNYYDSVLRGLTFANGYISSESIDDPICQQLIERYGLQVYVGNTLHRTDIIYANVPPVPDYVKSEYRLAVHALMERGYPPDSAYEAIIYTKGDLDAAIDRLTIEVDIIMFGSTCANVVLSNGTFSWLIGILAFDSKIIYPKIQTPWHGDIFVYPDWIEVPPSTCHT